MISDNGRIINNTDNVDEGMSSPIKSFSRGDIESRKAYCRYGSGCTHVHDPAHREKFWHPSPPKCSSKCTSVEFIFIMYT